MLDCFLLKFPDSHSFIIASCCEFKDIIHGLKKAAGHNGPGVFGLIIKNSFSCFSIPNKDPFIRRNANRDLSRLFKSDAIHKIFMLLDIFFEFKGRSFIIPHSKILAAQPHSKRPLRPKVHAVYHLAHSADLPDRTPGINQQNPPKLLLPIANDCNALVVRSPGNICDFWREHVGERFADWQRAKGLKD